MKVLRAEHKETFKNVFLTSAVSQQSLTNWLDGGEQRGGSPPLGHGQCDMTAARLEASRARASCWARGAPLRDISGHEHATQRQHGLTWAAKNDITKARCHLPSL